MAYYPVNSTRACQLKLLILIGQDFDHFKALDLICGFCTVTVVIWFFGHQGEVQLNVRG